MKLEPSTLARRLGDFPSLPGACRQLSAAVQNPDSSLGRVSSIVRKDLGLSLRVLRLANSVLFGYPAQIATVEQAVQLIGLQEIRNLAQAMTAKESFDQVPPELLDVTSLWAHSYACGVASALVGEERNHSETERLFTGGLFHEVGRVAMLLAAPKESLQVLERCQAEGRSCSRVEFDVFGIDHTVLGAELLTAWNLPRSLVQMVRAHHGPSPGAALNPDAFAVHYGDFITTAMGFGWSGESLVCPLTVPPPLASYLLTDERLDWIAAELEHQCPEARPALPARRGAAAVRHGSLAETVR